MDFGSGTWKGAPPLTDQVMPPNTPEYRSPEAMRFELMERLLALDPDARGTARKVVDLSPGATGPPPLARALYS